MSYDNFLLSLEDDPQTSAMLRGARYLAESHGVEIVTDQKRGWLYGEIVQDFSAPKSVVRPKIKEWIKENASAIAEAWPDDMLEWISLFSWAVRYHGPDVYPDAVWEYAASFRHRYYPKSHLMWKEPRLPLMCEVRRLSHQAPKIRT